MPGQKVLGGGACPLDGPLTLGQFKAYIEGSLFPGQADRLIRDIMQGVTQYGNQ
jgi:hypothetical protein